MVKVKPVQNGRTTRMSFSHINEVIGMPNLIEIQKNSYNWFLEEGLHEVFHDIAAIEDYTGNLVLEFVDYRLDKNPKYSIKECKERDATYAAPLYVTARLFNKQTGEVKEQEIFMGDFPLMTDAGTFISNGAERAIVSQLVRSPGVFYGSSKDRTGKDLFTATMNPNRGAWLEYETDSSDVYYVRIDKNRKLPVTTLLRALGLSTDEQIKQFFRDTTLFKIAGKTGTTSSNYDRYFVGYTPYYTGAGWSGYDQNASIRANGNPAAQLWKKVMREAHENLPNQKFNGSTADMTQVTVCTRTGLLQGPGCTDVQTVWVAASNAPALVCDGYV